MVLQDQDPILPSPLIMNNICSASRSLSVMNGFGENVSRELDGTRELGCNGGRDGFVAVVVIVYVIGTPHCDTLITFFLDCNGQRLD